MRPLDTGVVASQSADSSSIDKHATDAVRNVLLHCIHVGNTVSRRCAILYIVVVAELYWNNKKNVWGWEIRLHDMSP